MAKLDEIDLALRNIMRIKRSLKKRRIELLKARIALAELVQASKYQPNPNYPHEDDEGQ